MSVFKYLKVQMALVGTFAGYGGDGSYNITRRHLISLFYLNIL